VWLDNEKLCSTCRPLALFTFSIFWTGLVLIQRTGLSETQALPFFLLGDFKMSSQYDQNSGNARDEDDGEFVSHGIEPSRSAWKAAWQNNKGMFLILLSEIAGSSMDAIVRFLQQGGHSMHPFQVCTHEIYVTSETLLIHFRSCSPVWAPHLF
jgi:hypothetical protein